jgi:integrase
MIMPSLSKDRHNPQDMQTLGRGFPDTLKLFQIPASRFWYVGMYLKGRGFVRKSTRCERFTDARGFASDWYEERVTERRNHKETGGLSFSTYASKSMETRKREMRRGNIVPVIIKEDQRKLDKDVLPVLGEIPVTKIDYNLVDNFIDQLITEKELSASSLKKYVILIRQVLKEAERDGVITGVPALPTVKSEENPRPWFTPDQYGKLLVACRELRNSPPAEGVGAEFDFDELYDFIVFMVHTFLRPSEWKYLQHKHIRVMDTNGVKQLVISVPNAKTKKASGSIDSTSTEVAADVYIKKILKRNDDPNAYVFFAGIKKREKYTVDKVSRLFRVVCDKANLGTDAYGQKHTTYSLRHSALCFQILKTGGSDLLALAKNARTSTDMLEKFYLSHLTPQMPEFAASLITTQALNIVEV